MTRKRRKFATIFCAAVSWCATASSARRSGQASCEGCTRSFPNREIEDILDDDPIFHSVFNLDQRIQVGNFRARRGGRWYRADGEIPRWRGVRDDRGRVVVAINFNNDLGDSWQLADNPEYPEKFSSMGIRLGVNYVVYSLTH